MPAPNQMSSPSSDPPTDDCCCCRRRDAATSTFPSCATVFFLLSAFPLALIVSLEISSPAFSYRSGGWLRECVKWDPVTSRFFVSTFFGGGVAEIAEPRGAAEIAEERVVLKDPDVAGNSSLGIYVDQVRRRLLVVYADALGFRYGAVAAYDMESWARIFLTRLSGDEVSYADDVVVDGDGIAYVTDAKGNKIWKVGLNGELLSVIKNDNFVQRKGFFNNLIGLNGIVYHPNGYLLVVHTSGGDLFKIDLKTEAVSLVKVKGSLARGDGLLLISPTKLVIAGTPSRQAESSDDWATAKVTGRCIGPMHRIATSATVKDGKVYLNHLFGFGLTKKKHLLAEGIFSPVAN